MQNIIQHGSDEETEFIFDSNTMQLNDSKSKISKANDEIKQLNDQNKELATQLNKQNELLDLKHKQNQQLQVDGMLDVQNFLVIKLKSQLDERELKLLQSMKEKQSLQNELICFHDIMDQTTQRNDQLNSEVFALRLTMEQLQCKYLVITHLETTTMCKEDSNQILQRELKLKENIEAQTKTIKQYEETVRKITNELNQKQAQFKIDNQNKDNIISDLKRKHDLQLQQNTEIISELIQFKNQNLQNNFMNKDYKPELTKMTKEIEEYKIQIKGQNHQIKLSNDQILALQNQIQKLEQSIGTLLTDIQQTKQKLKEKESELQNKLGENMQTIEKLNIQISQLNNQLQLFKNQDQKINLVRSISQPSDERYLKELQQKNDYIAMLQNENNQLVKLIETLQSQKSDNQGSEVLKVRQLESELKNLQSFIYDSPLVVLFNLLEDRLSKQQQKSFENKKKIQEFWSNQLKQWAEGFEELKKAFNGLKIQFKYDLKYPIQGQQQNE
ncbi:unnamed protein product (macronuclear) [Paramecium tetraurelia]|uniref:Uncharacterized protein n=1 Tax=Paramecium tetraurelia TaxID=5888 RepID=A0BYP3_PARTE|nr:uncharacterized protein GSPATT00033513001 [Paramecium tetraurelia]CAK63660.1 unnamed protein product [Paramecium tetraurelia]|eukprot:XP_001431058.1 hypothetical protein (macronuclear) [Paramecium tetraurelia strain d4-2]